MTAASSSAAMEGADHKADGVREYWRFLAGNRPYRLLVIGEIINSLGGWANFVATLNLVERLGGGSAVLVSFAVTIRVLPSLLMFPAAGVVADRFNRVVVLTATNLASAVTVLFLLLVRSAHTLWLMYVLLAVLFSVGSFTDPARKALTQQLVPQHKLHLAATLDAFTWSLMAAVGASAGGMLVSALGTTACFLIDAASYLVAAGCSALILGILPAATANVAASRQPSLQRQLRFDSASSQSEVFKLLDSEDLDAAAMQQDGSGVPLGKAQHRHRTSAALPQVAVDDAASHIPALTKAEDDMADGMPAAAAPAAESAADEQTPGPLQQAVADLREGWAYMAAPGNRDVAAFTLIKASGALVWGASDVLYVKFSEAPAFQIRDSAFTMGLLFGAMGVGAFLGPAIFNHFTPNLEPYLLRSCALATASLAVGYVCMTAATDAWLLLPSVVLRSLGSAALWIYSTLLLQFRVPNEIQGRVFALEMAFYVSTETISLLLGGVMFDRLHLSTRGVATVMAAVGACCATPWCILAVRRWRRFQAAADHRKQQEQAPAAAEYSVVPQEAVEDGVASEEALTSSMKSFSIAGPQL